METISKKAAIRSARTMSGVLFLATCGVVALAAGAVVWMFAAPQSLLGLAWAAGLDGTSELGAPQQIGLLTLGVISLLGWALVLCWVHRMFSALAQETPHAAVRIARRIAVGLWVLLAWQIFAPALGSLVATWHLPAGQRAISIGIGMGTAGTLLSALIASSMAKALQYGAELWQDHKEII